MVGFAFAVALLKGESHFEVPLFGSASKASAAEELYTNLFLVHPPAVIINASGGLTVTSVPLFLLIIAIG
jgi:hypothetical protein